MARRRKKSYFTKSFVAFLRSKAVEDDTGHKHDEGTGQFTSGGGGAGKEKEGESKKPPEPSKTAQEAVSKAIPSIPSHLSYTGETSRRLYRASDDDYVNPDSTSFSEDRDAASQYHDNPGFGGENLYRADVEIDPKHVLDMTGSDNPEEDLAEMIDAPSPKGIGIDEWIPRVASKLEAIGIHWVRVAESYPSDSVTWIHIGGGADEPELRKIKKKPQE